MKKMLSVILACCLIYARDTRVKYPQKNLITDPQKHKGGF